MKYQQWLKWIGLLGLLGWNTTFAATCSIQSGVLPFSTYNTLQTTSQTVVSSLNLSCTNPTSTEMSNGVIVQVGLGSGEGTIANRYLTNGTDKLYYNVYEDPAYQTILGLGAGNGAVINACLDSSACGSSSTNTTGSTLLLHFYGAVPPQQDISPGNYNDNLLLQITF